MYTVQPYFRMIGTILCSNGQPPLCGFETRILEKGADQVGPNRFAKGYGSLYQHVGASVYSKIGRARNITARMSKRSEHKQTATSEGSEGANEDILFFFFQLDLTTRIQCALNSGDYELAQQLQNKLSEVEQEAAKQKKLKLGLSLPKDEAQDTAITIMRLRTDLQQAIDEEDYALAAELRNKISKLQGDSLAAEARALVYQNTEYAFRLGQKVRHAIFGYRGVVCGMDPFCCETRSWISRANIDNLSRGCNQPFYQVLVDVHNSQSLLVAYVAEENLRQPEEPDLEGFDHPYIFFLFYGMDAAGDYIPIKQLREKYGRSRHEVDNNEDINLDEPGSA